MKHITHSTKGITATVALAILLFMSSYATDNTLMHGLIITKWLWFAVIAIPIGIVTAMYLLFKPVKPVVTHTDVLVILLLGWILVRTLLSVHGISSLLFYVVPVLIVWLFVRLFITDRRTIIWTLIIYLTIVGIQCILGLLQLYGFVPSLHSMYNITGTFHNPGPYSGFLVSGLPMALGLFLIAQRARRKKQKDEFRRGIKGLQVLGFEFQLPNRLWQSDVWLYYFSQLIIVLLLLVLPAARSRAAWLGGIAGCVFVFGSLGFRVQGLKNRVQSFRFIVLDLTQNPELETRNLKLKTPNLKLVLLGFLLCISIIGGTYGIYKLKQGSADGRLLMWQVSWEMIKDKPLMGYGARGFEANYSNYQAEWFRSGKGTPEQELVAGTPDAPFNEFIRVWVEYGAVGILLILIILYLVLRPNVWIPGFRFKVQGFKFRVQGSEQKNKEHETRNFKLKIRNAEPETRNLKLGTVLKGSLLSIIVFSLFSYPLDVAPIVIQIIILTALISNLKQDIKNRIPKTENIDITKQTQQTSVLQKSLRPLRYDCDTKTVTQSHAKNRRDTQRKTEKTQCISISSAQLCVTNVLQKVIAIVILFCLPFQTKTVVNRYNGHKHWKEAYQLYQYQIYDDAAEEYKEAIKYMSGDGMLIQMYGKCLAMDRKWDKSKIALTKAKTLRSDPILCTALGDTYKALKEYDKAETAYWQAWYMVPHKFYPKYLLAKLYDETGQHNKATKLAKELINKTAKVESTAVKEIKEEMQKIINMHQKQETDKQ